MSPGETFWTHPEVLRAVCELVIDAGAAKITVVESIYDQQSYADYGYKAIVESVDATFVDLNNPAPYSGVKISCAYVLLTVFTMSAKDIPAFIKETPPPC